MVLGFEKGAESREDRRVDKKDILIPLLLFLLTDDKMTLD